MRFSTAIATLLVAATTVSAVNIPVTVGGNGTLTFSPTNVTAAAGDVIVFTFAAKNHTVTQSTFTDPCTKANSTAIDSGFEPVSNTSSLPTFSVTINDTSTPLWIYCAQTNPASHCHAGMVFAANAPADKSFATFQTAAKNSSTSSSGNSTSTASSSAASATKSSAALGLDANVAGVLSLVGLVAGLTL